MKLKDEEILELNNVDIKRGMEIVHKGSTFVGYTTDVSTYKEVNIAYEHVKYHNMAARHIVCACIIPGTNVLEQGDYEDDSEHGAGRTLLEYMKEIELTNRVIFVARYYDGTHIGPKRFECLVNAAKSAVNQKPWNQKSNEFHFLWPKVGRRNQRG